MKKYKLTTSEDTHSDDIKTTFNQPLKSESERENTFANLPSDRMSG